MSKVLLFGFAALIFVGFAQPLLGQNELKQKAQLTLGSVRAIPEVYIPLHLHASDEQLFVPYCDEGGNGEGFLCTIVGAHLEVHTPHGWRPAKLRTTYGVMGVSILARARGKVIPPRSTATFMFKFSTLFFAVKRGQQLRIVVDAWPDEQSMRAGVPPSIQLTSPPFECPGLIR